MFGLFKKTRKALVEPTIIPGALQMVPVRRSTFEGDGSKGRGLVQDVVHFVHKLQSKVNEVGGEIPPLALQSHYADQYVSIAASKGHRTYFESCGDGFAAIVAEAMSGLKAMGATSHIEVLEDMLALYDPSKIGAAYDGMDEELSVLDTEIATIEFDDPMSVKNAAWIRGWLILQVIEDCDYKEALHDSVRNGPILAEQIVDADDPFSDLSKAQREFAILRKTEGEFDDDVHQSARLL